MPDVKEFGSFRNPDGYNCTACHVVYTLWILPRQIFRFSLLPINAIAYYDPILKKYVRPKAEYYTNKGSVPGLARLIIPSDMFERAFCFHDSEYSFGGVWLSNTLDGTYVFTETSRSDADERIYNMVGAEGGNKFYRDSIWVGVRLGGGNSWKKGDWQNTQAGITWKSNILSL